MGIVDRVKSRRFYALVTFSIVSLVVVWLQLDPSPGFHQIMGTARVQFRELPNNVPFQVFVSHCWFCLFIYDCCSHVTDCEIVYIGNDGACCFHSSILYYNNYILTSILQQWCKMPD